MERISVTVYNSSSARNSLAPDYIKLLFNSYKRPANLRNLSPNCLHVPLTKLSSMGDRAFSVYTPKLWNTLSSEIQTSQTLSLFKKTY